MGWGWDGSLCISVPSSTTRHEPLLSVIASVSSVVFTEVNCRLYPQGDSD